MYRFLAFAWPDPDEDRAEEIRRRFDEIEAHDGRIWVPAYRARGLEVWHSGSQASRMDAIALPDGGVLLGRALSKAEGFPEWTPCSLAEAASSRDPVRKAEWLVENIWGSYVVFLPRQDEFAIGVIRDPGGGLPCFRARWNGFDVFTSNAELYRFFPGLRLGIDFDSLTASLLLPLVRKSSPCLQEVEEVLPGECLGVSQRDVRTFLWNPVDLSRDPLLFDTAEAAHHMRNTLIEIVDALVRPFPRVLHNLGGLDSSILLSCLAAARGPEQITCVNFYTDSFIGDERRFARAMSAHAGVPLSERRFDPDRVDLRAWSAQEMGPSPPLFEFFTLAGDVAGLTESLDVDVLSYGAGGDGVFYQAPHIFSALDYVAARSPAGGLGRVALEGAAYGGRSLSSTLRAMVRERLRPSPCFETIIALMDPGLVAAFLGRDPGQEWKSPGRFHPTLIPDDAFPKGKLYQILASAYFDLESIRYRFPRGRDCDFICPLIAQPFVELCLRIPTWQLADGGVSRGLARRAFWNDLPREISGRTSKCSTDGLYEPLFARNLPALREGLLDGVLVESGFLRRETLEMALGEHRDQLVAADLADLFDLYALEAWSARWGA